MPRRQKERPPKSEDEPVTLGGLLTRWRNGLGWSQRKAAKAVETHQGTWSKWEREQEVPTLEHLQSIAKASGGRLGLDDLIAAISEQRKAG